jgi:hypothetical protein
MAVDGARCSFTFADGGADAAMQLERGPEIDGQREIDQGHLIKSTENDPRRTRARFDGFQD